MNGLPWWTLPVPTVDGRTVLDCHYSSRRHRAVILPDAGAPCSGCGQHLTSHAWAPLDRSRVLCGACHGREHAGDTLERANAVDAYNPADRDPDQPTLY